MTAHSAAPRSPAEQARVDAALRDLCERLITFNQILGLRVESLDPLGGPRLAFPMRPELVGHIMSGRLHGGVTSAVLDATGGIAVMAAVADKHRDEGVDHIMARFARVGTIDLRIDFLRPGIGRRFVSSATVVRLGGRIGTTNMRLESDTGVLVATGAGSYVLA